MSTPFPEGGALGGPHDINRDGLIERSSTTGPAALPTAQTEGSASKTTDTPKSESTDREVSPETEYARDGATDYYFTERETQELEGLEYRLTIPSIYTTIQRNREYAPE